MDSITEHSHSLNDALISAEAYRKEKYALYNKNKFVTILIGVASGCTLVMSIASGVPYMFVLPVIGTLGAFFHFGKYTNIHWQEFKKKFKTTILKKVIESLYPGISYQAESKILKSDFNSSGLFSTSYTEYKGEDYFSGIIESTRFEISELAVTKKTSSYRNGKNTTNTTTVFKGLFVVLDFQMSTYGETYIFQDVSEKYFGGLGKYLQKTVGSYFQKGEMIYFENHPEFEKDFVVYSSDEIETRRLLTPGLIRAIAELKYKCGITPYLSFIKDKTYMAFSQNKDFLKVRFDLDLVEKQHEIFQIVTKEIALCMSLIKEINTETIKINNTSRSATCTRISDDK